MSETKTETETETGTAGRERESHRCPGCAWIDVPLAEQRARKGARVGASLARFPELAAAAVGEIVAPEPALGYRTRAKLVAGADASGRPVLGVYRPGTHEVVEAICVTLAPELAEVARAVQERLDRGALVPSASGGVLEGIDARIVVDDATRVMLTLIVDRARATRADVEASARELQAACPTIATVAVNLRGPDVQLLGPETRVVLGEPELRDRVAGGPWILAAPGSVVQAHSGVAAAIHETIAREVAALGRSPRVVELHAGSGGLALRLARSGARVSAVESFVPAIERARRAARDQVIALEAIASDATEALVEGARNAEPCDAILLDPPRRGVPSELRAAIARLAPRLVGYVSCDPDTLARDLAHLARLGYAPSRPIVPLDMIPQTAHVECLAILGPAPIPPARTIHEDERLIVVAKDPHEPTTPHPEHVTSTLARVRLLPGAERAVPVHRLDAGTSGVCLFARAPELVAPLAAALGAGRKSYVALVRGIARPKGIVRRALRDEGRMLEATTRYTRRAIVGGHSLVRASPEEGRLHQIRRHLATLGHPVLGDERHGHLPSNRHLAERAALDRTFLHCERIELALEAGPLVLEQPLAPDLELVLERLRARDTATDS